MGANIETVSKQKIHFIIQKEVKYGQAVYIVGNIQQLGNWNIQKSLRLSWNKDHFWTAVVELPTQFHENFIEYKYFISDWNRPFEPSRNQYEDSQYNRILQIVRNQTHIICENVWNIEKITLNLIVQNYSDGAQYFVTGDCKQLGNWTRYKKMQTKGRITEKNYKNNSRKSQKGDQGMAYTFKFQITRNREKINCCFLRKNKLTGQNCKPEIRQIDLNQNSSLSSRPRISRTKGQIQFFQKCCFKQLQTVLKLNHKQIPSSVSLQKIQNCQKTNEANKQNIITQNCKYWESLSLNTLKQYVRPEQLQPILEHYPSVLTLCGIKRIKSF